MPKIFKYAVYDYYDMPVSGVLISIHDTLEEAKKAALHYTIYDCDGEAATEIWKIDGEANIAKKFVRVL